jgi:putative DNA-invertase from lambdoid prophage Rac
MPKVTRAAPDPPGGRAPDALVAPNHRGHPLGMPFPETRPVAVTAMRGSVERGVSGSRPLGERPEGSALLEALRPGGVVITPKLDRMFRSALDALGVLGDLKDRGVTLRMIDLGGDVTGNGVSKLVFTILSAVAEAERVAEVKADQRARGRFLGGSVPFGWRREGSELVPVLPRRRAGSPPSLRRVRRRSR